LPTPVIIDSSSELRGARAYTKEDYMAPAESTIMVKNKSDTPARIEIQEVESPAVQAKQL